MIAKFVVVLAFGAVARCSVVPLARADADYTSFAYDVADPNTGDFKSQVETRVGGNVVGQYSLLDADGTKRTVDYSADDVNGFNAVVRKDPAVVAAAPVAVAPAVVAARTYAAPAVYAAAPAVAHTYAAAAPAVAHTYAAAAPAVAHTYAAAAPAVAHTYAAAAPAVAHTYAAAAPAVTHTYAAAAPVAAHTYAAAAPVVAHTYAAAAPVAAHANSPSVYAVYGRSHNVASPYYAAYANPVNYW